jgi:hypothetical protein
MPRPWKSPFVTREEFENFKRTLNKKVDKMASQQDVDALQAQVDQDKVDLTTGIATVQAEVDALVVANPAIDVTNLQASVAALSPVVADVGAIKPTPPGPPAS